jgi:hypothetical protein
LKFKLLISSLLVIGVMFSNAYGISAAPIVKSQPIAHKNLSVWSANANNWDMQIGNNIVAFGSGINSSNFTPRIVFPDWADRAWNAQLGLTMSVPVNGIATAGMISRSTATSLTASNSYFSITYTGVGVNPPFNQTGGLDMKISILKSIGNFLSFGYNSTNVNASVQPPLTSEWTVGEILPNGNTVASVTATTVTDVQGNVVASRPIYVVGSIAVYSSTCGGYVTTQQANSGFTTGKIGVLYSLKASDSSSIPQTGYATWSISGSNFILTLPTFAKNPVYPITLSPAGDTFGYTTAGGTAQLFQGWNTYIMDFYPFVSTSNAGTATTIEAYEYAATGSGTLQFAIYTDGATSSLIGYTGNSTALGASGAWLSASITNGGTISPSTKYDLCSNTTNTGNIYIYYDSNASYNMGYCATSPYGTWPSSITWTNRTYHPGYAFSIYCSYQPSNQPSNSPNTLDFGTVMPGTTYYANGSGYSNPVTAGQCTFTITNSGSSSVNLALSCTNATGGNMWTIVSSSPTGDQFKIIAVYYNENPSNGIVLTTSNQSFATIAGSSALGWDFEMITGGTGSGKTGTFDDSTQKTFYITITGS